MCDAAGGARASGDRAGTSHGSHGGGGKDSVREEENGAARGGVVGAVKPHSRTEHNHDHHNASAHHVNNSNHNKEATSNSASVKDKDKEEPRSSGRRQKVRGFEYPSVFLRCVRWWRGRWANTVASEEDYNTNDENGDESNE